MTICKTALPDLFLIVPRLLEDERGGFMRVFCDRELASVGLKKAIVQINHSYNLHQGTFRGLHFQKWPYEEAKLVRCIRGSICDIVVDLRPESPAFLQHVQLSLSAANREMLYIPEGMAHGFITLEDNTEVLYLHTEYYRPEANAGISVFSEILAISLPEPIRVISEKDKNLPNVTPDFKWK
jgi:dTDP-4-dehydrorhamnose 3,5-epimerase